ncbi:MAG: polyphosphate kinase 2 family protein [Bacteroidota bacterium]
MNVKIDPEDFRYVPGKSPAVTDLPNAIDPLYERKKDYRKALESYTEEIHDLQNLMYAHDRYSLLLVFQGMDTAGKDGAIRHVMSGINPAGVQVFSFKKPTPIELDHDWMWRTSKSLPERGRIGIFNRSYYEEVLVVKVHPGILTGFQRIPEGQTSDADKVFEQRYQDIVNFEDFLYRNGTHFVKFFLNISKDEQKRRLIDRIDRPEKNWKMSLSDIKERGYWENYQGAYQDLLTATSTERAPWYVIPGNDKKNARLIISQIVMKHMKALDMAYPTVTDEFREELKKAREVLESE